MELKFILDVSSQYYGHKWNVLCVKRLDVIQFKFI